MNATRKRVAPLALALILTLALSALGLLAPGASAAGAYNVTITSPTDDTVTADKATANQGDTVTLNIAPPAGYFLKRLAIKGKTTIRDTSYSDTASSRAEQSVTFTMPAANVTVTATFEKSTYNVSVGSAPNGSVSLGASTAKMGDIVAMTVTENPGYEVGAVTLARKDGGGTVEASLASTTGNKKTYNATMPPSDVMVSATFKKISYPVEVQTVTDGAVSIIKGYNDDGSPITDSTATAQIDDTVTLEVIAKEGKRLYPPLAIFATTTPPEPTQTLSSTWNATQSNGFYSFKITKSDIDYTVKKITVAPRFTDASPHNITVDGGIQNGTVTKLREKAPLYDTVRVTVKPNDGYVLDKLTVTPAGGGSDITPVLTSVSSTTEYWAFTMPDKDVTVSATFTDAPKRTLTVKAEGGGTVVAKNIAGEEISNSETNVNGEISQTALVVLELTPKEGYELTSLTVTGDATVTKDYTFSMPKENTTVTAVFKKTQTITPKGDTSDSDSATVVYGNTIEKIATAEGNATLHYSYSVASGDAFEVDDNGTLTTLKVGSGVVHVEADETTQGDPNDRYAGAKKDVTVTVTPRPLTVTADAQSKVYGDKDPELTYKVDNLAGEEKAEDVLTDVLKRDKAGETDGENVGEYEIKQGALAPNSVAGANYEITVYNSAVLTITAKEVTNPTIEIALPDGGYTYDGKAKEPAVTVKDGDKTIPNTEYEVSYKDNINAGTATVTVKDKDGGNYTITEASATFTINPAKLTVAAKDREITYGDAPANDGVTYAGFVNGEGESVLSGDLAYDYAYAQYGDVGNDYKITPKGLSSNNYDIAFADGKLTVSQREVGLEWGGTEFVYDGAAHAPTATATNLVNDDAIQVTVEGAEKNAGDYTAKAVALTGDKSDNYKLPADATKAFTIAKADFPDGAVTAAGYEGAYDGAAHGIAVTAPEGAAVGYGAAEGSYGLDASPAITNVSESPLTVYYRVTKDNYNPKTGSATVTITPKPVTVSRITAKDKTYDGTKDAALVTENAVFYGRVGEDKLTVAEAAGTFADANAGENKTVAISGLRLGGASAGNYELAKEGQQTEATANITAKEVTNPAITLSPDRYTYDGRAKTPAVTVEDGETTIPGGENGEYTVEYSNNINAGTNDGTNPPTVTVTDKDGGNYTVNGSATFTINKAGISPRVTLDGWTYGEAAKTPVVEGNPGEGGVTYEYQVNQTGGWTKNQPAGAGTHNIRATVEETANYYGATTEPSAFTIAKAPAPSPDSLPGDQKPKPNNRTYDGTEKPLVFAPEKLPEGYTVQYSADGGKTWQDEIPTKKDAGDYPVKVQYVGDDNHTSFDGDDIDVTIDPAALTITAENKNKTYGEADPEFTYKHEGLVDGDQITGALSRDAGENVGAYDITQGDLSAGDNYAITYEKASLTIAKASAPSPDSLTDDQKPQAKDLTYNGAEQELLTPPKETLTGYTVQYSADGGKTWQDEIPTKKDAGDYPVKVQYV
ncbi:MAG: hypothetical protein IKN96_09120, partial [Oscillibacter sp.]|nr:hypothetical protein [Oscillibacter sp.]